MLINAFAVALAAAQVGAAAPQAPLNLTCLGGGTANKVDVRRGNTFGSFSGNAGGQSFSGSGSSNTTVYGRRQQGFDDQVDVRLFEGDDRIRMPRTMLPMIRGGKDG